MHVCGPTVVEWVHETFERFGDPWFRKTLFQADSSELDNMAPNREKLEGLLGVNVMTHNR